MGSRGSSPEGPRTPPYSTTVKHTPLDTKLASSSPSSFALQSLWTAYIDSTSSRLGFINAFLVFLILSGDIQLLYCILVTRTPFNAFLVGFGSMVGQFVLTASLHSQVNATNRTLFKDVSPERAFADFVVGSIVLHFFVFNFLG